MSNKEAEKSLKRPDFAENVKILDAVKKSPILFFENQSQF